MYWPLAPASSMDGSIAAALAGLLPLAAILYGALRAGLRQGRIPNQLVLTGIAAGLLLHTVLPDGNGFLAAGPGGAGPWRALGGLVVAAAALFPFYRMGAVGAGQVKLMAVVGTFLGPVDVVPAILGTLLAGGGVGLAVSLRRRCAGRLFANLAVMARRAWMCIAHPGLAGNASIRSVAESPDVVAAALGTLGGILWVVCGGG